MKNLKYTIFIWFATAVMLSIVPGCQKSPINGELDGQWQVMTVEPTAPETIIHDRMYVCISLHTCQLSVYGSGIWTSGNMSYSDDKLTMEFPNANSPESIARLKQYGIYSNPVTFTVIFPEKNKLILKDKDAVVTLRKF